MQKRTIVQRLNGSRDATECAGQKPRRLALMKESIRCLTDPDLSGVAGGVMPRTNEKTTGSRTTSGPSFGCGSW